MIRWFVKTATAVAGVVTASGVALTGAAVAHAEDFSGKYAVSIGMDGGGSAAIWTVTPCGDACVHITSSAGGTDTDAYRDGPYWVFERDVDPGIECPGNSYVLQTRKLPATIRFTINPDTLKGQYQPVGTPCGAVPLPTAFQLAKVVG